MGIYKGLVGSAQSANKRPEVIPSNRIITPANIMTASRPILGGIAAKKLITGERYATPYIAAMAASDAEGNVARLVDRFFPNSGRGTTTIGVAGDVLADSAALLEVCGAILVAPKVTKAGKLAVATVLGQEGRKAAWFYNANKTYMAATISEEHEKGEKLNLPVSYVGKEGMIEKFGAIFFAAATNDTDNKLLRPILDGLALGHAIPGAHHGEIAIANYQAQLDDTLGQIALQKATIQ